MADENTLYGYDDHRLTHQPRVIFESNNSRHTQLAWDANGNLSTLWMCGEKVTRFHDWDDENRLWMTIDYEKAGYYGYDANGDRVYKLTGKSDIMHMSDEVSDAFVYFDNAVLYPNPYVTITKKGYTKHYYANGERLATSIGRGGFCKITHETISHPETDHEISLLQEWIKIYNDKEYPFEYDSLPTLTYNVDIAGQDLNELQYWCPIRRLKHLRVEYEQDILRETMSHYCEAQEPERDIFYTHGDHLGSASWITDFGEHPIQYLHYLPYGQLLANQAPYGYDERYKFTGKERDAETGYDFFGARYYWSLFKHWTKVDPLVDDYLHISPYAYCNWNPIKYVDPDGRDAILITFPNYKAEYKGLHLPYTGHSGVLLINTKTGLTKYYEYGRYDGKMGRARNIKVPNVKIKDGKPILKSLNEVLKSISNNSGRNGNIEGAYIESDDFESMMNYAEGVCAEADNPEREPYNIFSNNCATFAEDVITQDESIDKPVIILPTPVNVVNEYQKNGNAKVVYNSETQETSLEQ